MRMNILLAILSIVISAPAIHAQINNEIIGDARSSQKAIKGAPFSADGVTESVQILADGTRITRTSKSKIYRDSEGRYRRDEGRKSVGVPGDNVEIAESIMILDPVSGLRYELNVKDRTFRQSDFKFNFESMKMEVKSSEWKFKQNKTIEKNMEFNSVQISEKVARVKELEKQADKLENQAAKLEEQAERSDAAKQAEVKNELKRLEAEAKELERQAKEIENSIPKPKSTTESLGFRDIEGVQAAGHLTTTIIPAGTIGNDRDISITYEKWYSGDLQMTIFSKHSDPRFGEHTFRLGNISRNDPPLTVFLPPADYTGRDKNRADPPRKPIFPKPAKPTKVKPVKSVPAVPAKAKDAHPQS